MPATAPHHDGGTRVHYTIVWSDPAGLDLASPAGTYVRASVESLDVSAVNGDAGTAVPGFWNTLSGPAKRVAEQYFDMGPARPEYGVKRYEILDKLVDGPSTTVTVCAYNQQIGHELGTGEYEFGGTGPFGVVITFQALGRDSPPARQSGPQILSATPVFGSWRTTRWEVGYFADGDPCAGRPLPGVTSDSWPRTRGSGPHTTTEVPTEPSYPGWPQSPR